MQEFDKLIRHCSQRFDAIPFCSTCVMSQCRRCNTNNCYNCLAYIHSIHTKDEHYNCEKITYNYILKYGYRYASEMAWAFWTVKSLIDLKYPISIYSVGCGPSTELYGAVAVFRDSTINYYGFDQNDMWQPIQHFNEENFAHHSHIIKYYDCDFINYVSEKDIKCDILVLNYFFSDFVKYKPIECDAFINDLVCLIEEGRFATIIINDVMLLYSKGTGYACMEKIAGKLKSTNHDYTFQLQRRHFSVPNAFQFEYGVKLNDTIGFTPIIEEAQQFDPFTTCGSIQLVIKTSNNMQQ